ncbi:MAG TPA: ubiquitin-like domain-containing protein [Anaerolineales bacterium]
MTLRRIRKLAVIAAVVVAVAGYLSFNRQATILVDGEARDVVTHAVTVGGALRDAGVALAPADEVEPRALAPLRNDMIIAVHRASEVQLYADGKEYRSVSAETDAADLLADFGIELAEGDRLLLAGEPLALDEELPNWPLLALEVRRAVAITLAEEDETQQFLSSAATLGEALAEQGISLYAADDLQPAAETPLTQPLSATLTRSQPLVIRMGEQRFLLRSSAQTVGEALAEAGIALQGFDRSQPAEGQPIPEDRRIRVVRVAETVEMEQEVVPFEVEWVADPETELGSVSVVELGQNGLRASRIRVRYEDGVEVSRTEESQWVLAEPVTQISGFGSTPVVRTTVVDGQEIEYWAAMDVYITSYSPCRSGVEQCLYGTSAGVSVEKGVIATYLDWYRAAKGVQLYVPGYGYGNIYDVGGGFPDGRAWIDLGYSDDDWVTWSGWYTVYFTTPVPSSIPYFLTQ